MPDFSLEKWFAEQGLPPADRTPVLHTTLEEIADGAAAFMKATTLGAYHRGERLPPYAHMFLPRQVAEQARMRERQRKRKRATGRRPGRPPRHKIVGQEREDLIRDLCAARAWVDAQENARMGLKPIAAHMLKSPGWLKDRLEDANLARDPGSWSC